MKKLLMCMILAVMTAALAACGDKMAVNNGRAQDTGIRISAEAETDTIQDIQDRETNDIETEADADYESDQTEGNTMKIMAGDTTFTALLADNSSAEALKELLAEGPLTIDMSDYGDMEKGGSLGRSLPRNDEQITTGAGDIILYQGNSLVIYYDTNS